MIKRYDIKTVLSDYGNDHGLKRIVETQNGEWIKWQDLKDYIEILMENCEDNSDFIDKLQELLEE